EAMRLPSGKKATAKTGLVWPSYLYSSLPLSASQTRTTPAPPETMRLPSGENAAQMAALVLICFSSLPDSTSQTWREPSALGVTRRLPSGEKHTLFQSWPCPVHLRTSLPVSRSHRRIRVHVYVAASLALAL